ncbi:glycosyltransferase family 4 protein [Desulfobacterota bacterium AH_259_B03_O07]|nr:glycosyltransferase family 4 protein [Desulfobacterota bacterium AH_259_B03_O07]
MNVYRLAILTSHPIQYQAPLFRRLSQHPQIDLMVYFCWDFGVGEAKVDPGFGIAFSWDVPLLEGYRYRFLRNYSPSRGTRWPLGLINPAIVGEMLRGHYDALMVHGYTHVSTLLAYVAARFCRTPVIFRGETVLRPDRPWWFKLAKRLYLKVLFRRTDAFLTIGSRSEEFYRAYGIPEKQMFFTPYSVDNEYFYQQCERWHKEELQIKQALGIPDVPIILYVGKLVSRKRPLDLLKAFAALKYEAALVYVGEGLVRSELEQYVQEMELPNTFLAGFQNQSELPKYYSIADLFVLPSSSHEVSPLVINEAMACGLPIIVSDAVPSAIDFVQQEDNGYVYPVGDVDALTSILTELLRNEEKRRQMGERSLEIIKTWNHDVCVENIVKALEFVAQRVKPLR